MVAAMRAAGTSDEWWEVAGQRGVTICVELFERYVQLVTKGVASGAGEIIEVQPEGSSRAAATSMSHCLLSDTDLSQTDSKVSSRRWRNSEAGSHCLRGILP